MRRPKPIRRRQIRAPTRPDGRNPRGRRGGLLVLAVNSTDELVALRAGPGILAAALAPITTSLVFRHFDDENYGCVR